MRNDLNMRIFRYFFTRLWYTNAHEVRHTVNADEQMMNAALDEAKRALSLGELPVGAVVVRDGQIIARGHNDREGSKDPTGHAEIVAMRRAAKALGGWRLSGCTLYVTLEPCPMCAGAIVQARVDRVVWGCADVQSGCAGSVYRIPEDPAFAHFAVCEGGVLEEQCKTQMYAFFSERRKARQDACQDQADLL